MKKVICIGSVTKDIFVVLDKTRVIDNPSDVTAKKLMAFEFGAKEYAESLREDAGGSAVNVAAGLTKGGMRAFVFARTSKREIGKWIIKKISRHKIKKNYMQQTGKDNDEVSVIISDKSHVDHVILRTGDSVENFDLEKAFGKFREKVDWVFVASQKKNWQENIQLAVDFAKNKKAKIAINPSGYQISNGSKQLKEFLPAAEIVFLNRDEAIELVKNIDGDVQDDVKFLMEKVSSWGAKTVVVTDGENGANVCQNGKCFHLGISADVRLETVGAGDAFASGFLSSYIEDNDAKRALAWGIANSSSVISQVGATEGLMTRKELVKKGEELISKIEINE